MILLSLFCVGCAHVVHPRHDSNRLPGIYRNGDGFWPRWLELREDGSYVYTQMTDVIREVDKDQFAFEGGWSFGGRWTFVSPDRIEMTIESRSERITVIVRPSKRYELAILEPDLFPDIVGRWKDDGSWGYLKKEKPNKAPEPTPRPVTDRADARSAPDQVVAHL